MAEKSKILFIGGTGYIGKFIVEASAKSGHPTFVLIRETTLSNPDGQPNYSLVSTQSGPAKSKIIDSFKNFGVNFVIGDLYDHESLVKAIKQVDVVISTLGYAQVADQMKIIAAIKEAGNVKRFLPSEFGNDVDRVNAVGPAKVAFATKAKIRRAIEAEGIPYTYVANNFFAGYFLSNLSQDGATAPPRDKIVIFGDGIPKAIFNKEDDIGAYTIRAVDDPRTLNKNLYLRPPGNIYSFNDLVSLWEKKIDKSLERIYVPEDQILKNIEEASYPLNALLSIFHSIYVKGDQTNFEIEPSFGVEASELYPDVNYTTVDEYLNQFV
ncbi:NmrA domain-containing protein [Cephalotus follicularis]|uniref:NmrA domain-containing protein n=1 Tax=Cephalotus follicularis TaxID=3775 RepID=A0A1Q3ARS0_CEPFO|nr:NmrA domain-containing protein [Cephalotus follicularis]